MATYNGFLAADGTDTVHFGGAITSTITPGSGGTGNGANRLTLDCSAATLSGSPRVNFNGKAYINANGGRLFSAVVHSFLWRASGRIWQWKSFHVQRPIIHGLHHFRFYYLGGTTDTCLFCDGHYCPNLLIVSNYADNIGGFYWSDKTLMQ